jgi:Rrf2 family protein
MRLLKHAAAYALHALTYLARRPGDAPAPAWGIAAACGLPERYLKRILNGLAAGGLLTSALGPSGGYRLARPAGRITMLDVVEAVQGPIRGEVPETEADAGDGGHLRRRLQRELDAASEVARRQLGKVTLADLAGP